MHFISGLPRAGSTRPAAVYKQLEALMCFFSMHCRRLADSCLTLIFCLALLSAPVSASQDLNAAASEEIVFNNFSNQIILIKEQSQQYLIKGTEQRVTLSDRIIVKASQSITKDKLYQYHSQISNVSELFTGSQNIFYSLSLHNENSLADVLNILQNKPGIGLVQPDILQLKNKSDAKLSNAHVNPYIERLGIPSLWKSTKGAGVKIAIIDDGFNLQHAELSHVTPVFSYDSESRALSSLPLSTIDSHGTKVAGIIFAAHNNVGINGIAPEAELITLRQPDSWTSNTLLSFQLAKLAGADIINCSWQTHYLLQPIADVVNELASQGRGGKGIAVIFSSGNQGREITALSTEAAIASAIVVGASGHDFTKPLGFSNFGQSVDILAYGLPVKTTLAVGGYGLFSGTSLSAAVVAGLSALIISQQPDIQLEQLLHTLQSITTGSDLG